MLLLETLPFPASYFPLQRGVFSVTPGLVPLTTAFGNGAIDERLFQIDNAFPRFLQNVRAARAENINKYVRCDDCFEAVAPEVNRFLANRLAVEYPAYFDFTVLPRGGSTIHCHLTKEQLYFDAAMNLLHVESEVPVSPPYINAFDALLSQVPEDMAVVLLPEGEADSNIALHITAPSNWIPAEKIGRSFLETHEPVPHFEKIARASDSLLRTMVLRPPFVRFNWGIEFTDRLNLHPEAPPTIGRTLDNTAPCPFYLRLERQVLWGLKDISVLLFSIRIYTVPVTELSPFEREMLLQTLLSMPAESRVYKSFPPATFDAVTDWLQKNGSRLGS